MIDKKKLEEEFKNMAEVIIGNVGEPTSDKAYSPTGEQFGHYSISFKEEDVGALLVRWGNMIDGLRCSARLNFGKRLRSFTDEFKPKLYWRILPTITNHFEGITRVDRDMYTFRTRLLVSCNFELKDMEKEDRKEVAV